MIFGHISGPYLQPVPGTNDLKKAEYPPLPPPMWNLQKRLQRPLFHVVGCLETKFQENQMKDEVCIASQNKFRKKWRKIFRTFDPPPLKRGNFAKSLKRDLLAALKLNFKNQIEDVVCIAPQNKFRKKWWKFFLTYDPPPLKGEISQNL